MIKNFLMRKMMQKQMKGVPPEQAEMVMNMVENNPELFEKIVMEAQIKIKEGKPQMTAMMEVMKAHEKELRNAVGKNNNG